MRSRKKLGAKRAATTMPGKIALMHGARVGPHEVICRGTEDETAHAIGVPTPAELRDRSAHRVADGQQRLDAEHVGERDDVVGAVDKAKVAGADAVAVAAVVDDQKIEPFGERRQRRVPVEAAGSGQAVEQYERRRAARATHFP